MLPGRARKRAGSGAGRGQRPQRQEEDKPPGVPIQSLKRERSASSLSLDHVVQKLKAEIRDYSGPDKITISPSYLLEDADERNLAPDPIPYKENDDFEPFDLDKVIAKRFAILEESYAATGWVPYHKVLGEGQFGRVYLGFLLADHEKEDEERHLSAFKIVPCSMSSVIQTEVVLLRCLVHVNIIHLIDVFMCPHNKQMTAFIILEFADAGSLADECYEHGTGIQHDPDAGRIPEPIARRYFQQVASAIAYMHDKGIAHCDLHVNNILMKHEYEGGKKCLIADFGSSEICWLREKGGGSKEKQEYTESHNVSTHVSILAPDLARIVHEGTAYAITGWKKLSSDIWSLGCTLHYMLTGEYPLGFLFNDAVVDKDSLSETSYDFISKILVSEEKDRICIKEIMSHEWMNGEVRSAEEEDDRTDDSTGRTRRTSLNLY